MRIMEFLSKLHRYYLKLSGKKKLLVFVVVFILGFILGSAFSNYKNASEMKKEAYQGNEYEHNQAEKKHEDKD